jgi:hypothetical protein
METIEKNQIDEIAAQVATEILGAALVSNAVTTTTVDSRGRDALKVTINLTPGSAAGITGKAASTTVFALKQRLQEAGEARFPIVRWSAAALQFLSTIILSWSG